MSFILAEETALKSYVQGLKVGDDFSPNRTVKVWFGYPDVEVRDQTFPYILIDLIDLVPGTDRQTYGYLTDTDYSGNIAATGGVTYTYPIAVAYDIVFQITTYARHPRHDLALMQQLFKKFPSKYGYLIVPNALGTENSSRSMFLDGFIKRDTVEGETGNRRLLRSVFTVRVLSEMTPDVAAAIVGKQVTTVTINATTSSIPSSFIPVH